MIIPKFVISKNGKEKGTTTGGSRMCQLSGCGGLCIGVRWSDGKLTWPCSKGMSTTESPDSMKIG
jgi:hypothetical protein